MSDTPETPIVVNASPVVAQVNTALRDIALVATAVPALTALLGKHDMLGLIKWAASSEAAPAVSVGVSVGVFVWRQIHARRNRAEKVAMAEAAPDSVAVVKK